MTMPKTMICIFALSLLMFSLDEKSPLGFLTSPLDFLIHRTHTYARD